MDKFDTLAIVTEQAEAKFGDLAGGSVFILEHLKDLILSTEGVAGAPMSSKQIIFCIDALIETFRTARELDIDFLNKLWDIHDL